MVTRVNYSPGKGVLLQGELRMKERKRKERKRTRTREGEREGEKKVKISRQFILVPTHLCARITGDFARFYIWKVKLNK